MDVRGESPRAIEEPRAGALHALHVNVLADPEERDPKTVLDAWFTLPAVAAAVASAGADVTVVQAATRDAELVRDGVRYCFVRTATRSGLRARLGLWASPLSRELIHVVRRAAPDVLHFHSLSFPRHVRALTRAIPDVPLLVQDHADRPPPVWRRSLHRRGLSGVDAVAFTATAQAERFVRAGVLSPCVPIWAVPESSSDFAPGDRAHARAATGVSGDPCLLWLGNLDANKDPLMVLDAVARAVRELPDIELWCAFRHGALLPEVQKFVAGNRLLAGRVHLLGAVPRERVELLLRAADFLVQGSHREGSGYAVIEALACGTPPIVTDIPAFRALTGGGAVGGLVVPGDAAAMARALVEWSGRNRLALRRAARSHFEKRLGFDVVGRRLVDAYRTLLKSAR